jgi:5,10-methenyltetrahydrofolate synthetase
MTPEELRNWRKAQRQRLVAARGVVAMCWPVLAEYDARYLGRRLRERGATTALPVVVAPRTPLAFREWHPGVELAEGAMRIPYPVGSREVIPDTVLLPMNGWDAQGYRLGYGAGYFDRTLASLAERPRVIGVAYEMARLETIHPQPWDIPADFVATEKGVYRRGAEGTLTPSPSPKGEGS